MFFEMWDFKKRGAYWNGNLGTRTDKTFIRMQSESNSEPDGRTNFQRCSRRESTLSRHATGCAHYRHWRTSRMGGHRFSHGKIPLEPVATQVPGGASIKACYRLAYSGRLWVHGGRSCSWTSIQSLATSRSLSEFARISNGPLNNPLSGSLYVERNDLELNALYMSVKLEQTRLAKSLKSNCKK